MSEKIFAVMAPVENPVSRLESNLKVKVTDVEWGLEVQEYGISLSLDNPKVIANNADGFPLWLYFQFTSRRSSDLRNRYFDIVRALGLKEMWFMWEDLMDFFEPYEDDIPTILTKITAPRRPEEFAERSFEEFDLQSLLNQTPYRDDIYPYRMFYHDAFTDLFQQVAEIERRDNVIVLGLTEFKEGQIRILNQDGSIGHIRVR